MFNFCLLNENSQEYLLILGIYGNLLVVLVSVWNKPFLFLERLNIIDLDKRSNQPFEVDELMLTFNGEIYNYLELRRELQGKNIKLKTKSDTEVLLYYYKLYGEKCVYYF